MIIDADSSFILLFFFLGLLAVVAFNIIGYTGSLLLGLQILWLPIWSISVAQIFPYSK